MSSSFKEEDAFAAVKLRRRNKQPQASKTVLAYFIKDTPPEKKPFEVDGRTEPSLRLMAIRRRPFDVGPGERLWEVELATGITSRDCGELDLRSNFDRKEKRRLRRAQHFKKVDEALRVLRVEGAAGLERLRLR